MEYLNEQTKLEHPECRCDTPNNIGASNIRPNTPDPNIACPTPICPNPMRLWVIKYAITGTAKFIGQAIVQAPTIEQAQCIFGKDSRFNGYVDRLKITCCHEVFPHPEPILLQEDCVAIIDRRNLKTYPFVLKSDFDEFVMDVHKKIIEGFSTPSHLIFNINGVKVGDYHPLHDVNTVIDLNNVTVGDDGLMSKEDKLKLDSLGLDTTNTEALTTSDNELFNNVIQLHKISKTGTFSDLLNIPDGVLTINYPKGDGTTETKSFTDNADTNETVTIPSEIDDTLAQDYKTYSSNKIEDFIDNAIGKGELIIQKNGTNLPVTYNNNQTKQAFGANDYDYCIVNIPVPTQTSELTNNGEGTAGYPFITKAVNNLENYYTESEVDNLLSQLETNIDWKEAVNTYNDIATTYPNPQDGWTVNVKDTDYTYRYNGTEWVAISANAIPLATHSVNGLMSATDKTKLDSIEPLAQKNVQSDWNQSNINADDYIKNKPIITTITFRQWSTTE